MRAAKPQRRSFPVLRAAAAAALLFFAFVLAAAAENGRLERPSASMRPACGRRGGGVDVRSPRANDGVNRSVGTKSGKWKKRSGGAESGDNTFDERLRERRRRRRRRRKWLRRQRDRQRQPPGPSTVESMPEIVRYERRVGLFHTLDVEVGVACGDRADGGLSREARAAMERALLEYFNEEAQCDARTDEVFKSATLVKFRQAEACEKATTTTAGTGWERGLRQGEDGGGSTIRVNLRYRCHSCRQRAGGGGADLARSLRRHGFAEVSEASVVRFYPRDCTPAGADCTARGGDFACCGAPGCRCRFASESLCALERCSLKGGDGGNLCCALRGRGKGYVFAGCADACGPAPPWCGDRDYVRPNRDGESALSLIGELDVKGICADRSDGTLASQTQKSFEKYLRNFANDRLDEGGCGSEIVFGDCAVLDFSQAEYCVNPESDDGVGSYVKIQCEVSCGERFCIKSFPVET